jgi:hypothetical protein
MQDRGPETSLTLPVRPSRDVTSLRVSSGLFVVCALLLMVGVLCLGASWWLRPIAEAEQAMSVGASERAVERYAAAHERFDRVPITKIIFPGVYDLVIANELSLLYSLQRYDEVIEKAGAEDANEAAPFWEGCALFDKGLMEEKPEARVGWISQAHQQFRRALDVASNDWDAKFNYELTGRLIGGLQKQPQAPGQDMMKLLRESPKAEHQPVRKVG